MTRHGPSTAAFLQRMRGQNRRLADFLTQEGREEAGRTFLFREPVGLFLTDWQPTSPAACSTHPSERYYRWQDAQQRAELSK